MVPVSFLLKGMAGSDKDIFFEMTTYKLYGDWQSGFREARRQGQSRTTSKVKRRRKTKQGRQRGRVLAKRRHIIQCRRGVGLGGDDEDVYVIKKCSHLAAEVVAVEQNILIVGG